MASNNYNIINVRLQLDNHFYLSVKVAVVPITRIMVCRKHFQVKMVPFNY